MQGVRIAWNADLPVVASQAFTTGGRAFADGDAFPWRDLGVSESDAFTMWRAGLVNCVAVQQPSQQPSRKQPRSSR